jgi:hypothetical protein
MHRPDDLADDLDALSIVDQGVERLGDRAFDGVLDRHEAGLDAAGLDCEHDIAVRVQRDQLYGIGALTERGAQSFFAISSWRTKVADPLWRD